MVLIKDEQLPSNKWLLGRVIDTHAGKDGLTRVVTLKNKNTILKRPITKICLLPIDDNEFPANLSKQNAEVAAGKHIQNPENNQRITRSKTKIKPNVFLNTVIYIMTD